MGKGKRIRERKAKRAMREETTGELEKSANETLKRMAREAVPLGDLPEHKAQMKAWKDSGAVPGPGMGRTMS